MKTTTVNNCIFKCTTPRPYMYSATSEDFQPNISNTYTKSNPLAYPTSILQNQYMFLPPPMLPHNYVRYPNSRNFNMNPEMPIGLATQPLANVGLTNIQRNHENIFMNRSTCLPHTANWCPTLSSMENFSTTRLTPNYIGNKNMYNTASTLMLLTANTNGAVPNLPQSKTASTIKDLTFPHQESYITKNGSNISPAESCFTIPETSKENSSYNSSNIEVILMGYKNPFDYPKYNMDDPMYNIDVPKYNIDVSLRLPSNKPKEESKPPQLIIKWICAICNEEKKSKQSLIDHYEFHKKEKEKLDAENSKKYLADKSNSRKKIECERCSLDFPDEITLSRHSYSAHSLSSLCFVCGKIFGNAEKLKFHMKLHADKNYVCNVCGKSFHTSNTLVVHLRTHSGEKPYKCTTCDKCFTQRSPLVIHQRLHTGERPFVCPTCDKRFVSRSTLSSHSKTCR
ncbi:hypothetical protein NQ314_009267 [Rhamnusium bicolor]|uniref:C2H2-type domain-containing protein n=1 Tax=Rhamnusium bicolor TaxID=1586634 RepID=A0AAV8Y2D0_9CUCU|nr:hypothetical protein NQ314_009267 [Rhamnusium bicolor]